MPLAICDVASVAFRNYWRERLEAQSDALSWANWQREGRESSLLLRYFKPELSDDPAPSYAYLAGRVKAVFDPLRQSSEVVVSRRRLEVGSGKPETDDLVAATGALLRKGADAAVSRYREKIERLVIGVPSFADLTRGEGKNACDRRREAAEASYIARDFGTTDFALSFLGEAQAAGVGLNIDTGLEEAYSIIIDMGAGTTDMGLIKYRRRSGQWLAENPVIQKTIRFAGRDINLAIADALCQDGDMALARQSMDDRSWQLLLDEIVERIKKEIVRDRKKFEIPLHDYARRAESCGTEMPAVHALRRTLTFSLSVDDKPIRDSLRAACKAWSEEIFYFLIEALDHIRTQSARLNGIELVGGAFRFQPLRQHIWTVVHDAGAANVPIQYRDNLGEAQMVVARGLARWVALQP
jgi:molecular chaperone DnaK (HSP70)